MNIDELWKYRGFLYTGLIIGLSVLGIYLHFQHKKNTREDEFIRDFRNLNASFFPADIVPHPNLPEPNYPDPNRPRDPNDPKNLIDLA